MILSRRAAKVKIAKNAKRHVKTCRLVIDIIIHIVRTIQRAGTRRCSQIDRSCMSDRFYADGLLRSRLRHNRFYTRRCSQIDRNCMSDRFYVDGRLHSRLRHNPVYSPLYIHLYSNCKFCILCEGERLHGLYIHIHYGFVRYTLYNRMSNIHIDGEDGRLHMYTIGYDNVKNRCMMVLR